MRTLRSVTLASVAFLVTAVLPGRLEAGFVSRSSQLPNNDGPYFGTNTVDFGDDSHKVHVRPVVIGPFWDPIVTGDADMHEPGHTQTVEFHTEFELQVALDSWSFFDVWVELVPKITLTLLEPEPDQPSTTNVLNAVIENLDLNFELPTGSEEQPRLQLRQEPGKVSGGESRIDDLRNGWYRCESFFDIYFEVRINDGAWLKADAPARMVAEPAPGAALLGVIGLGLVGWVKRRMA